MSEEPTIYEVAAKASVSISTVSLALNHPDRVKPTTLSRILGVADEIGFVPKERAVVRARRGLGRIAAVGPFSSYPSYMRRLAGALDEIDDSGTQLLVYDYEDVSVSGSPLLSSLPVRGHVDGLIIMGVEVGGEVTDRLLSRLPAVLLDIRHPVLPSVYVDDFAGASAVGAHLQRAGHARVAFIGEVEAVTVEASPVERRLRGLEEGFGQEGIRSIIMPRTEGAESRAVDELLASAADGPVTAIFAYRDLVGVRIVRELRKRGIRVPEEMEVIGYDDDPMAEATGLSTVRHPFEESGRAAVRLLQQMVSTSTKTAESIQLPFELVLRDTTRG
ncbi:LacI family DNA-binding transcriptional regulator [Frondihabitans cladoniiphilus]|uniref:LacI family DNA-binding transcriptional regulator n=1 Tax=Frondihabitans cladoniiphilus TaxID=715785 RepID=A0ABP8VNL7_9MICO